MEIIILITLVTVLASAVGTLSGFGIGTIMAPILLMVLPFNQTVVLVAIVHWFHNIWKLLLFGLHNIDWTLFFYFGIPGMITSYLGARLIVHDGSPMLPVVLGLFLIGYVLLLLVHPTFKIKGTKGMALLGGALSGFFAGIFGIRGAIKSAFLSAFHLPKKTYIVTTGAISVILDSTRLITYWYGGMGLPDRMWWGLLLFIPASFVGSKIAQYCVGIIPQHHFRTVVAVFILLVGIRLVFFPLTY